MGCVPVLCWFFVLAIVRANPETVPSPNVCRIQNSLQWVSPDCPKNALCVPAECAERGSYNITPTHRFCSCRHTSYMLDLGANRNCVPTLGTYIYASYLGADAACCLLIALHMVHTFLIAHRLKILKLDIMIVCGLFNMIASFVGAAALSIQPITMLSDLNSREFGNWVSVLISLVCLYAFCITTASLVFAVAAHTIVLQSYRWQKVDVKTMYQRVVRFAISLGLMIGMGGAALLSLSQFAAADAYFAIFSLFAYYLFRRIGAQTYFEKPAIVRSDSNSTNVLNTSNKKIDAGINTNRTDPQTANLLLSPVTRKGSSTSQTSTLQVLASPIKRLDSNASSSSFNRLDSSSPVVRPMPVSSPMYSPIPPMVKMDSNVSAQTYAERNPTERQLNNKTSKGISTCTPGAITKKTMHEINVLVARLKPLLVMFAILAVIFIILWYEGRSECNRLFLGPVVAVVNSLKYTIFTVGMAHIAYFMRQLVYIRKENAKQKDRAIMVIIA